MSSRSVTKPALGLANPSGTWPVGFGPGPSPSTDNPPTLDRNTLGLWLPTVGKALRTAQCGTAASFNPGDLPTALAWIYAHRPDVFYALCLFDPCARAVSRGVRSAARSTRSTSSSRGAAAVGGPGRCRDPPLAQAWAEGATNGISKTGFMTQLRRGPSTRTRAFSDKKMAWAGPVHDDL